MSGRPLVIFSTAAVLLVLAALTRGEVRGPQTYATALQNITSDRTQEGFIQIFGMAINKTQMYILADNRTFVNSDIVSMAGLGQSDSYNNTPKYSGALLQADPVGLSPNTPQVSNFGIIMSSDQPMHFITGKSDLGTSDAYYNFPQTNNSVRFLIAGWPRIEGRPFLAMIMVIPVLDGTCVEVYKIFNGIDYFRITTGFVGKFQVFRYFAAYEWYINSATGDKTQNFTAGEDVTGFIVNASRPVQVIFGAECAWVPSPQNLFCDYMADALPPMNQLGKIYIIPPIYGRSTAAGYIARIVPSEDNTVITVSNQAGPVTKRLGEFLQIDCYPTNQPVAVVCDKPCLVAQYNKGYLTYKDVPTDPFMTVIVPSDRFTAGAPFGTISYCKDQGVLLDFDNYMSIVTYANYAPNILYDGEPISNQFSQASGSGGWISISAGGDSFSVAGFPVRNGFHYVSMSPSMEGSFAVYVYGHSLNKDSSSGYGIFANYNSTGIPVSQTFSDSKKIADASGGGPNTNATCTSEAYLVGSIITGNIDQYVSFPFNLTAYIDPGVPLTDECLVKYHDQLLQLLRDFSRKINYWICVSQNCSYLGGEGVAINYATLKVTYIGVGNIYTSVQVYVEMVASMTTTAQNFAQCRAEIKNYMYLFANWPPAYTPALLHQEVGTGCPFPIPFKKSMFEDAPLICPTVQSYDD